MSRWSPPARSPRSPFGRIARIEFRVDDTRVGDTMIAGGTLAMWTSRGIGYSTRCTEGSPLQLIYVTAAGRELDVILPCDDCPMAEPAWRHGRAGWDAPALLTRVGELLAGEAAARDYAEQFDEDERDRRAIGLYWAADPFHVHTATED